MRSGTARLPQNAPGGGLFYLGVVVPKEKDFERLVEAGCFATRRRDRRAYYVGAIGLRSDGALVRATNGPAERPFPAIHAEARLIQKLDVGATVWVARSLKNGHLALAKPCPDCERALRRRGVKKVIYSTGPQAFEVLNLN